MLCKTTDERLFTINTTFLIVMLICHTNDFSKLYINTLKTGSFKLFKRPFPGFLTIFNPLNVELKPICYLLALLAHHFLHISRIRVKSLTLRLLMSYKYIHAAPILDVSRSHTTTQHSR